MEISLVYMMDLPLLLNSGLKVSLSTHECIDTYLYVCMQEIRLVFSLDVLSVNVMDICLVRMFV